MIGATVSQLSRGKVSTLVISPRVLEARRIRDAAKVALDMAERVARGRDDPNVAKALLVYQRAADGVLIEEAQAENDRLGYTTSDPRYIRPQFSAESQARRAAEFEAGQAKFAKEHALLTQTLEAARAKQLADAKASSGN